MLSDAASGRNRQPEANNRFIPPQAAQNNSLLQNVDCYKNASTCCNCSRDISCISLTSSFEHLPFFIYRFRNFSNCCNLKSNCARIILSRFSNSSNFSKIKSAIISPLKRFKSFFFFLPFPRFNLFIYIIDNSRFIRF